MEIRPTHELSSIVAGWLRASDPANKKRSDAVPLPPALIPRPERQGLGSVAKPHCVVSTQEKSLQRALQKESKGKKSSSKSDVEAPKRKRAVEVDDEDEGRTAAFRMKSRK